MKMVSINIMFTTMKLDVNENVLGCKTTGKEILYAKIGLVVVRIGWIIIIFLPVLSIFEEPLYLPN